MSSHQLIVGGSGTGVGKTLVAAILAQALEADYWKPVQAGSLDRTDSDVVRDLVAGSPVRIHPEAFRLTRAMSPHAAAAIDGRRIERDRLVPPAAPRLIIELAGGMMSPLRIDFLNVDYAASIGAPLVIVSKHYLGSINHTLLTIHACRSYGIDVAGIVFNGDAAPATEEAIAESSGIASLGRIASEPLADAAFVRRYAALLRPALNSNPHLRAFRDDR